MQELLQGPVFADLDPRLRDAFLQQLRPHTAERGERLFNEGEPGDSLWLVVSGRVSLLRRTSYGEWLEFDRAGAGGLFGELAVVSPALREATARALMRSELLALRRDRLRQLLERRDPVAEALMRFITLRVCQRLRQVDARIALAHQLGRAAPEQALLDRVHHIDALVHFP